MLYATLKTFCSRGGRLPRSPAAPPVPAAAARFTPDTVVRDSVPPARHRYLVSGAETPICGALLENNHLWKRCYLIYPRLRQQIYARTAVSGLHARQAENILMRCGCGPDRAVARAGIGGLSWPPDRTLPGERQCVTRKLTYSGFPDQSCVSRAVAPMIRLPSHMDQSRTRALWHRLFVGLLRSVRTSRS